MLSFIIFVIALRAQIYSTAAESCKYTYQCGMNSMCNNGTCVRIEQLRPCNDHVCTPPEVCREGYCIIESAKKYRKLPLVTSWDNSKFARSSLLGPPESSDPVTTEHTTTTTTAATTTTTTTTTTMRSPVEVFTNASNKPLLSELVHEVFSSPESQLKVMTEFTKVKTEVVTTPNTLIQLTSTTTSDSYKLEPHSEHTTESVNKQTTTVLKENQPTSLTTPQISNDKIPSNTTSVQGENNVTTKSQECKDKFPRCDLLKNRCTTEIYFMKEQCENTCGLCGCEDKAKDCTSLLNRLQCSHPHHAERLRKKCPLTCGACRQEQQQPTQKYSKVQVKTVVMTTASRYPQTYEPLCEDKLPSFGNVNCRSLSHYCCNPVLSQFMTKFCPKTCGFCESKTSVTSNTGNWLSVDCETSEHLCYHPILRYFMIRMCPNICNKNHGYFNPYQANYVRYGWIKKPSRFRAQLNQGANIIPVPIMLPSM